MSRLVTVPYHDGPKLRTVRVAFTEHAIARWVERTGRHENEMWAAVTRRGWADRDQPRYSVLSADTRAQTWGFLHIDENRCFALKRDPDGTAVATTFMSRDQIRRAA